MTVTSYNDCYNMALYLNTTGLDNEYMSFKEGALLNGAIGSGIALCPFLYKNIKKFISQKNLKPTFAELRLQVEMKNAIKDNSIFKTLKNAYVYDNIKNYQSKLPVSGAKAYYFKDAQRLLNEAKKLKGAEQSKKLKEFNQAFSKAKLDAYKAKFTGSLKPTTSLGKTGNALKTYTGIRALNTGIKTLNAGSKTFRGLSKFVKGNAAFALISVACDLDKFTAAKQVGGTKAMTKEIAKSTGVAVAESVGFMAGMKAGSAIGASVGTCFGPGVGTFIGGVTGALIGGVLGWTGGKIMHKALGCDVSEADKIGTKKAKLRALHAKYHKNSRKNLLYETATAVTNDSQTIEEAKANGLKEEDAINPIVKQRMQKAKQSIINIASNEPELLDELKTE